MFKKLKPTPRRALEKKTTVGHVHVAIVNFFGWVGVGTRSEIGVCERLRRDGGRVLRTEKKKIPSAPSIFKIITVTVSM